MNALAPSVTSVNIFVSVFTVSEYRRKLEEQYDSHDLFRADNHEAMEIRKKSSVAAMEDAAQWLKEEGNVAVSNIMLKILKLFRTFHISCTSYEDLSEMVSETLGFPYNFSIFIHFEDCKVLKLW